MDKRIKKPRPKTAFSQNIWAATADPAAPHQTPLMCLPNFREVVCLFPGVARGPRVAQLMGVNSVPARIVLHHSELSPLVLGHVDRLAALVEVIELQT